MKCIVAQGNPGSDYRDTRHNIGFTVIDAFAVSHSANFSSKSKFFAEIAEITIGAEKVLLVKPQTFYNETGRTYRALLDFYKLDPIDTMIIHDELSLPLGTMRVRRGGSDAGNNGIKSINAHGGDSSYRMRIGIHTQLARRAADTDFVLGKFSSDERTVIESMLPTAFEVIDDFIRGDVQTTTHRHDDARDHAA